MIRLGVNIDHVATVRNARGGDNPCPVRAALIAHKGGADGITAHLREDRRHIRDNDIERLKHEVPLPLNLEMAATQEMLGIALRAKPNAVCLVPEKRQELTTEGGLDLCSNFQHLQDYCQKIRDNGIRLSLFIDPEMAQIEAAKRLNADIVEFHTGVYAHDASDFERIQKACIIADEMGIECHAGHGLNYDNVAALAKLPQIKELNIGHFLIGEAIYIGLENAVAKMKRVINNFSHM